MGARGLLLLALLSSVPGALAQEPPAYPEGAHNWFGRDPIRIRLDLSNLTEESAGYAEEVRAALRFWEAGGNGRLRFAVRFEEVGNASEADVVLWLRDAGRVGPICLEEPSALGCARPFERPVPIEILARRTDGTFVPFRQIREVTEHELGHALGFGHSTIPGDVMRPHASLAAQTAWRPGDLARLVGSAAAGLALLGAVLWVGWRALRPSRELGRVRRITPDEAHAPCPVERRGHSFRDAEIDVGGRVEAWTVCVHCNGGLPVEALDAAREAGLP